jgi:hypothetical protein
VAKQRSLIASIHRDNDTPAMCEAIVWLEQAGWTFYRPTNVQLKIDEDISYYPDRGTIMIDGYCSRCSESGLPALQALLNRRRSQLDKFWPKAIKRWGTDALMHLQKY